MKRLLSLLLVGLAVGAGVWGYLYTQSRGSTPKFRTAKIERGPLTATVSTTGTLNAVVTVQVGSQVSGLVKELFADFNSQAKRNQLVARIDPEKLQAAVKEAQTVQRPPAAGGEKGSPNRSEAKSGGGAPLSTMKKLTP